MKSKEIVQKIKIKLPAGLSSKNHFGFFFKLTLTVS